MGCKSSITAWIHVAVWGPNKSARTLGGRFLGESVETETRRVCFGWPFLTISDHLRPTKRICNGATDEWADGQTHPPIEIRWRWKLNTSILVKHYQAIFVSIIPCSESFIQRLPSKYKKMYSDFEHLMDPSRNHRPYRVLISQMDPPAIPFLALILKGELVIPFLALIPKGKSVIPFWPIP